MLYRLASYVISLPDFIMKRETPNIPLNILVLWLVLTTVPNLYLHDRLLKLLQSADFDLFCRSVSHLQLQYHCCTFHITMENASSMKMPLLSNSKRKLITKRNMCFLPHMPNNCSRLYHSSVTLRKWWLLPLQILDVISKCCFQSILVKRQ